MSGWMEISQRQVLGFTSTPVLELNSAPAVQSFTVDRSLISAGVPVTLSWKVDPGTTGLSINQGVGLVTGVTTNGVGSILLDPGPSVSTVYEMTADSCQRRFDGTARGDL
jgi:hypothetical protein